jgi:subtilisin family serine protease
MSRMLPENGRNNCRQREFILDVRHLTIGTGILFVIVLYFVSRVVCQPRYGLPSNLSVYPETRNLDPYLRLLEYRVRKGLISNAEKTFVRLIVKATASESTYTLLPRVTTVGNIFTSYCPLSRLEEIKKIKEIDRIEIASECLTHHLMEEHDVVPRTFSNASLSYDKKLSGRSVIVGIVDVGFALSNPDFYDSKARTTNVLYMWDQTGQRTTRENRSNPAYGRTYDTKEILDAIERGDIMCQDPDGHGTAIASVCAGRWGLAPNADLILVKFARAKAEVIDAIEYIFRKAREHNRACVVNVSHGMEPGFHEGMSLFEQALDALSGTGRIIVCSAGNPNAQTQFSKSSDSGVVEIPVELRPRTSERPTDNQVTTSTLTLCGNFDELSIDAGHQFHRIFLSCKDDVGRVVLSEEISVFFSWERMRGRNLEDQLVLFWERANATLDVQRVVLRVRGRICNNGTQTKCLVRAWTSRLSGIEFIENESSNWFCPSVPSTARNVISVACCDRDGIPLTFEVSPVLSIASKTVKPDYYAPGQEIIASVPRKFWTSDKRHTGRFDGSSISAPQITGCVAWILELCPTLGPQQIKSVLDRCSTGISTTQIRKGHAADGCVKAIIPQEFRSHLLKSGCDGFPITKVGCE